MVREGRVVETENGRITIHPEDISDNTWDSFVCQNPGAHYTQCSSWAKVKETIGWRHKRIVLSEQGQIIAGVQLLFHPMPILGEIQYSIRGPLISNGNGKYEEDLLYLILEEATKHKCRIVVVQPPNNAINLLSLLKIKGFRVSQLIPEHSATLIIDLDQNLDKILGGMKRQTRQNIRRSEREGIQINEGKYEDLTNFYLLHQSTSQRQGFVSYPWVYIESLWKEFQQQNNLALLLAQYKGDLLSALLLICFGNTVFAYLLGWSGLYKELRPNDALFWGAIQWAKNSRYKYFDFGGVNPIGARALLSGKDLPEAIKHSPDFLKYGFGGEIVFSPPALDFVPNPLVNLMYRQLTGRIGGYNPKSELFRFLRRVLINR